MSCVARIGGRQFECKRGRIGEIEGLLLTEKEALRAYLKDVHECGLTSRKIRPHDTIGFMKGDDGSLKPVVMVHCRRAKQRRKLLTLDELRKWIQQHQNVAEYQS